MADDKEQHRQHIRRILTRCTEQHHPKQDQIYLKQKNQQVKDVQLYLKTSLGLLNIAQEGRSDYEPYDNMRVTGIEFENQSKLSRLKEKFNKKSHQSRRTYLQSIISQRRSSSLQSVISTNREKKQEKEKNLQSQRISLPVLMKKLKRTKKPANASKNSSLQYQDSKKRPVQEDITYEYIKSERQKVEQIRRLTVLGRVTGENYKKHLKKLEERKKLFMRLKVTSSS